MVADTSSVWPTRSSWFEPRSSKTVQHMWRFPRVFVRLSSELRWPPNCFVAAAVDALRSNAHEPIIALVDAGSEHAAAQLLNNSRFTASIVAVSVGKEVSDHNHASLLQQRMANATRVLWVDRVSRLPTVSRHTRRSPYELVWTWCPTAVASPEVRPASSKEECDSMLPSTLADFEVQAQLRGAASHDVGSRTCNSDQIHVRSRWARATRWTKWEPASTSLARRRADLVRGEWALEDACIAYSFNPMHGVVSTTERKQPWMNAQRFGLLTQGNRATKQIMWPIPWPDIYAEYEPGYTHMDSESVSAAHAIPAWTTKRFGGDRTPPENCTWHDETAFVSVMSMDNLYHTLIHGVPTHEYYSRVRQTAKSKGEAIVLLPHFFMYWPWMVKDSTEYIGWQLVARSLGLNDASWPVAVQRMKAETDLRACNCYKTMYGGHGSFMPPPHSLVNESIARVTSFRAGIAASMLPLLQRPKRRILFQLRRGTRQIVNIDSFRSAIEADPLLGGVVHFAIMEDLPVMEQYALVQSSTSLAGVHGMGLAWAMLLPSDSRSRSSCLEIVGMWPSYRRLDYYMLSRANGVYYMRMQQPASPECICYGCHYRICGNITANATQISPVLKWMVRRFDVGSEANAVIDNRPPPKYCHPATAAAPKRACPDYLYPRAVIPK